MRNRTLASLLATGAVLAAPAAAFAQSAGDNQYSDPFSSGGSNSSGGGSSSSGGGSSSSGGGSSSSGSGSSGSSSSGSGYSSSGTTYASGTSTGGPSLARTGAETGILALGGASLLLAGIALRLRLRETPERA